MVRSRGGASSSTRGAKGRKEVFVKGLPSLGEHFLIQTHNSAESPEIDEPALPLLEYEDGDATNGVDTEASGPSENPTPGSYQSMYYDLSQQMRGISLAQSDILQRHMDLSDFVHSEAEWNRRQWESLNARMDSFFSHYYQRFPGSSSTFPDPDPSVDDS